MWIPLHGTGIRPRINPIDAAHVLDAGLGFTRIRSPEFDRNIQVSGFESMKRARMLAHDLLGAPQTLGVSAESQLAVSHRQKWRPQRSLIRTGS
jgi:hypothetical protein